MIRWWQPFACLALVFAVAAAWDAYVSYMEEAKARRRAQAQAAWLADGLTDEEAEQVAP